QLPGPGLGDAEHGRAEIDPPQLHPGGIKRQVQAGADGDLQGGPGGLPADPGPAVSEQYAVIEAHLLVIGRRRLVPVALPPVTVLSPGHALCSFPPRRSDGPITAARARSRPPALRVACGDVPGSQVLSDMDLRGKI